MISLSPRTSKATTLLGCLAACLVLMGSLGEAGATLSGPQVLDTMLKQMGPAKTILVRQRVEDVAAEPTADPEAPPVLGAAFSSVAPDEVPPAVAVPSAAPLIETLTYQLPGGFRAEIRSETIQRLYLEVGGESLLTVDGHLTPMDSGWFEGYKDLFLFTRRLDLHRQLALRGVDLSIASLGLWNERPVHVLGAYFPDAVPAQIWVDKETLLPVRWLWRTGSARSAGAPVGHGPQAQGRHFEIRYDRWQLFGKRRYPLRVQFFENFELVRTLTAEAVVVNAEVAAGSMDMEAVRRLALPPVAEEETDPAVDPAVEEIHEAIDIFKKRYE